MTAIAVALILTAVGARPASALDYQVEHGHGVGVAVLHGDARVADDMPYTAQQSRNMRTGDLRW